MIDKIVAYIVFLIDIQRKNAYTGRKKKRSNIYVSDGWDSVLLTARCGFFRGAIFASKIRFFFTLDWSRYVWLNRKDRGKYFMNFTFFLSFSLGCPDFGNWKRYFFGIILKRRNFFFLTDLLGLDNEIRKIPSTTRFKIAENQWISSYYAIIRSEKKIKEWSKVPFLSYNVICFYDGHVGKSFRVFFNLRG